jgi:hypothetical protein
VKHFFRLLRFFDGAVVRDRVPFFFFFFDFGHDAAGTGVVRVSASHRSKRIVRDRLPFFDLAFGHAAGAGVGDARGHRHLSNDVEEDEAHQQRGVDGG